MFRSLWVLQKHTLPTFILAMGLKFSSCWAKVNSTFLFSVFSGHVVVPISKMFIFRLHRQNSFPKRPPSQRWYTPLENCTFCHLFTNHVNTLAIIPSWIYSAYCKQVKGSLSRCDFQPLLTQLADSFSEMVKAASWLLCLFSPSLIDSFNSHSKSSWAAVHNDSNRCLAPVCIHTAHM